LRRKKNAQQTQAGNREIAAPSQEFDDYIRNMQAKYAQNNLSQGLQVSSSRRFSEVTTIGETRVWMRPVSIIFNSCKISVDVNFNYCI
jgi:hypothetical protein